MTSQGAQFVNIVQLSDSLPTWTMPGGVPVLQFRKCEIEAPLLSGLFASESRSPATGSHQIYHLWCICLVCSVASVGHMDVYSSYFIIIAQAKKEFKTLRFRQLHMSFEFA